MPQQDPIMYHIPSGYSDDIQASPPVGSLKKDQHLILFQNIGGCDQMTFTGQLS